MTHIRLPTMLRDSTDNYRGGVRFEFNRFHVTLEQGGTTFKDDDQASFTGSNYGRPHHAHFWADAVPEHLTQTYGIRGTASTARSCCTAIRSPGWISTGSSCIAIPRRGELRDVAAGNFVALS